MLGLGDKTPVVVGSRRTFFEATLFPGYETISIPKSQELSYYSESKVSSCFPTTFQRSMHRGMFCRKWSNRFWDFVFSLHRRECALGIVNVPRSFIRWYYRIVSYYSIIVYSVLCYYILLFLFSFFSLERDLNGFQILWEMSLS